MTGPVQVPIAVCTIVSNIGKALVNSCLTESGRFLVLIESLLSVFGSCQRRSDPRKETSMTSKADSLCCRVCELGN